MTAMMIADAAFPVSVLVMFATIGLLAVTLVFFLREMVRDRRKRFHQTARMFFQPGRGHQPPPIPERRGRHRG